MKIKLLSDNVIVILRAIFTDTYNVTKKENGQSLLTQCLSEFGEERRVRGVKKLKSSADIVEAGTELSEVTDEVFSTSTEEFFSSLSNDELKVLTGVMADAEDGILGYGFQPYVEFMMDKLVEQVETRPIGIEEIWGMNNVS